ncbi:TonB-dependent receptor [Kamptonema cortianum]|nr:TonB-dependent receptor [Kamptonema cortianum]
MKLTLSITLSTLLCFGLVQAETQKDNPTKLAPVIVTGISEGSSTIPSPAVAEARLNLVPGGINFIDADDSYLLGRTSNLRDALDFQPGVLVQSRFGAEESRISIRGSGLGRNFHGRGILLLQDGAPLNLADGGFDMQSVEPLTADYIEVYRGGNGLFVGSATMGGAIDFVSRTGHTADKIQLRLEGGSFGYIRAQASSGLVAGPYDYYASFTHFSQDGFRAHSAQSNQKFFANVGAKINEHVENRFFVTAVQTQSELPGNLTKTQMQADPGQAAAGNMALNQKRDFDFLRLANRTTVTWDGQELNGTLFWSHKDLDHPVVQVIDQISNDIGLDLNYHNRNELLGNPNYFLVGFRPVSNWVDDNRFFRNGGNIGNQFLARNTSSLNLDLHAVNEFTFLPKWILVTGAEVNYASRYSDRTFPNQSSVEKEYVGVSPLAGIRYELDDKTIIYGNVSRSFEPPSLGELTNPFFPPITGPDLKDLQAQNATTIEFGSRGQSGRFRWDATYYHSWVESELLSYTVGNNLPVTQNADSTIHQGIELGLDITLFEGLLTKSASENDRILLRQVYNWQDFTFDQDTQFGNNRIATVPEHFYRAEIMYEHPGGFYAGPNVEWVPVRTYVDNMNTLWADPYALLGFKIGYRAQTGWSVFFEARNLTDETYASAVAMMPNANGADSAQFLPGDGRAFYGGVEWRW